MHTEKSPFSDAVAVWHMADLNDSAGDNCPLTIHGDVEVGAALTGAAREDSMTRGGDGYAAEFKGGYLIAGQDAEGAVNLSGKAMTFCIRMRDPLGRWNSPYLGDTTGTTRWAASSTVWMETRSPCTTCEAEKNMALRPFTICSPKRERRGRLAVRKLFSNSGGGPNRTMR